MGKKEMKFTSLSDIDHKLQFMNAVAVIQEISPVIFRGRLLRIELSISDQTSSEPGGGFTVKLNLGKETLSQFLNVAKSGYIIFLQDIKITKNEGDVYGEVNEEEEITLLDDNLQIKTWFPDEKPIRVTGIFKQKIENIVKWKKANFKHINISSESEEEKSKSKRSGLVSNYKVQLSSKAEKTVNTISRPILIKTDQKVSERKQKEKDKVHKQDIKYKTQVNKLNNINPSRSAARPSTPNKETIKITRGSKLSSSSEETSQSIESQGTHSSSSPLRITRGTKSNLNPLLKKSTTPNSNESKAHKMVTSENSSIKNKKICTAKRSGEKNESELRTRSTLSSGSSKVKNNDSNFSSEEKISLNENVTRLSIANKISDREKLKFLKNKTSEHISINNKNLSNEKISTIKDSTKNRLLSKEKGKNSLILVSQEKVTEKTPKRTASGISSVSDTESLMSNGSSPSSFALISELNAQKRHVKKVSRKRKDIETNYIEIKSQPKKKFCNENFGSPSKNNERIVLERENANIKSFPKSIPAKVRTNPFLNSSDSTLSDGLNVKGSGSSSSSSSKGSENRKKRSCTKAYNSPTPEPKKRLKLDKLNLLSKKKSSISGREINHEVSKETRGETQASNTEKDIISTVEAIENKDIMINDNGAQNKSCNPNLSFDLHLKQNKNEQLEETKVLRSTKILNEKDESTKVTEPQKVVTNVTSTRNTSNNNTKNNKMSTKTGIYEKYLKPLTSLPNFLSVESLSDTSLCDVEDATTGPDKMDFQCKVVSEFVLADECIQVIRVQDGSLTKCGTLRIPKTNDPSWECVIRSILAEPLLEEKSPYIDIIIFNYFRLDRCLKVDKFYRINNVMGIKLLMKNDPRPGRRKRELFFCVEGQNANVKGLSKQQIIELHERIASHNSAQSISENNEAVTKLDSPDIELRLAKNSKIDEESNSPLDNDCNVQKRYVTTESGSRLKNNQLNIEGDINQTTTIPTKSLPAINNFEKSKLVENSVTEKGKVNISKTFELKMNTSSSSDETMVGGTPPSLKEIKEILAEESALGLPLTLTEDIHLKNSGSEVTFSQFCEGAKSKRDNFRTSTQTSDVIETVESDSAVKKSAKFSTENKPTIDIEVLQEDSSKMEPLFYCPSGSSANSLDPTSPNSDGSVSVLQDKIMANKSPSKPNELQLLNISSDCKLDMSDHSAKNLTFGESTLEAFATLEALNGMNSNQKEKSNEIEIRPCAESSPVSPSDLQSKDLLSDPSLQESGKVCNTNHVENVTITDEDIEVISDSSSIASISLLNDTPVNSSQPGNNIPTGTFSNTASSDVNIDYSKIVKRVPDRCFYRIPTPIVREPEPEEDDDGPVRYICRPAPSLRHLPILTLDVIQTLRRRNSFTVTITFTSISPSFTDSWKETCFKARCPSCDKMYDIFNAATGKNIGSASETSAIAVGSHIVCPDSQCCNPTLDSPEFLFTLKMKLIDGTPFSAFIGGKHAEQVFGCSALEAVRNESSLNQVTRVLENIAQCITDQSQRKIVLTRANICNPRSGPLYITRILF